MAITQYFTWISDDSFFWREWEFYDCNNIDIIENSRYIDGAKQTSLNEIWISLWDDITVCGDSARYPVFASGTGCYIWFGWYDASRSDSWQYWAYQIEQIWTDTFPVIYWFKNWRIRQQAYNGATTVFDSTITINVPSGIPTSSCVGSWRIYFAVASLIYILDTAVTDPTVALSQVKATPANSQIPFGYTIKYIYIYMDVMNVVTTNGKDTTIYQLIEETTDVWKIRYYHTKKWVVCLWAYGDGNNIFWYSRESIYQSNWTESQRVKVVWKYEFTETFSPNSFCTISDWIFKIADWTILWEYWHKKPWYWSVLIKKTRNRQITAMSGRLEVFYDGSKVYWWRDNDFTLYPYRDWSWTSLPYEWNVFAQKKEQLAIRVWYILPAYSTYTNTSTLCSMTVQVVTDEMEAKWISTPITVATITTPSSWVAERYIDISVIEIVNAIWTAWHNPDFHYMRITINWLRWDLANTFTLYWENLGRKTPKLFSVEFIHKDIKKWIPQQ